MKLVEAGMILPVIYEEHYRGLDAVPRALEDARQHKAWGRAVLSIHEEAEVESVGEKARL
jgi:hypothetical protein